MKKSTSWLIAALLFTVCSLLQGAGAVRYVARLPDDSVGIGLYVANVVLFAVVVVGFYTGWMKEKRKEA